MGIPLFITLFQGSLLLTSCASNPPKQPTPVVQEDDVWTLMQKGETDKVKQLFQGKMDPRSTDEKGRTPLLRAAELRDAPLVSFFITLGTPVDQPDNGGRRALAIACAQNDPETVKNLVAGGANIFLKSSATDPSPAEQAFSQGGSLLSALMTKDTVRARSPDGETLLSMAVQRGNLEAVQSILALGAVVNERDGAGKTALDRAYEHGDSYQHALIAEVLVKAGGLSNNQAYAYFAPAVRTWNYNLRYSDGLTPLHYAAREGQGGFVTLLLERGAEINAKSASGSTPLQEAVRTGQIGIMKQLLAKGADTNIRDAKGNTALHIVLPLQVRKEGIALLLSHGAKPNIRDDHGDSPLQIAIDLNMGVEIEKMLIDAGADVNNRNVEGKTPLHTAVEQDRMEYIPLLLQRGADIFATDTVGNTPFDGALQKNGEALKALITPETVGLGDNGGNTILHLAVKAGADVSIISLILDKKGAINARNKIGDTALHIAVAQNEREIGELLISRGADIFATNAAGQSPLFLAAQGPQQREWMLNSTTLEAKDGLGNGILHYGALWKMDALIPVLIQRGTLTEGKNATGETPLFIAVKANSPSTIRALTQGGADLNARDTMGNSVLHAAVRWHGPLGAQELIQEGADVNSRNLAGKTPLHDAIRLGMPDMVTLLLKAKASLEIRDIDGNTALMEAVMAGNPSLMETLLDQGADPMARNSRGDTPLHIAVALNRRDMATLLLGRGVSLHAENGSGQTPFQVALSTSVDMVSTLLTKDRLSSYDDKGQSPLHIAVAQHSTGDIIKSIINLGANLSVIDSDGKTPLRRAVDEGSWDTARILIDAGADAFSTAPDGESPATVALSKGNTAIEALFDGKNINSHDSAGNTVLHYAAYRGNPDEIALLIKLGASKTIKNLSGETAYNVAKRWGKDKNSALLQ